MTWKNYFRNRSKCGAVGVVLSFKIQRKATSRQQPRKLRAERDKAARGATFSCPEVRDVHLTPQTIEITVVKVSKRATNIRQIVFLHSA
nr:hypothetical protein BgiMline_031489 [Biomphalaria glabrata]